MSRFQTYHSADDDAMRGSFVQQMRDAGLLGDLIFDDQIHRADVLDAYGRRKRGAASYRATLDDIPRGWYQVHTGGGPITPLLRSASARRSPDETAALRQRCRDAAARREAAERAEHARVARTVEQAVRRLPLATADHPYLRRKNVLPHGIYRHGTALFIPAMGVDGRYMSAQNISGAGEKKYAPAGCMRGAMYKIGTIDPAGTILVCEGFATGATLHEATGYPTAVAFHCGNLLPVVLDLHGAYPHARIVICADDDHMTCDIKTGELTNPGLTAATRAAKSVRCAVAVPVWPDDFERPEKSTDFNDLAADCGRDAVARIVTEAVSHAHG